MIDATESTLPLFHSFYSFLAIWLGGIVFSIICVLKFIKNDKPLAPIKIKDIFHDIFWLIIFTPILNIILPMSFLLIHYAALLFKVTKLDITWDRIKNTTIY
jgi:hypothetical protein